MTLQEFFEELRAGARDAFNKHGKHMPTFVIDGDQKVVISAPWTCPDDQAEAIAFVRQLCVRQNARHVGLVMEAWMAPPGGPPPVNHPQRYEALWIIAQSKTEDVGGIFMISRKDGVASVSKFEASNQMTTIFDGLLGRVLQ